MTISCNCKQIPDLVYYDELSIGFISHLKLLEYYNHRELFKCLFCGTLWRIDVEDNLQVRFVARINQLNDWKNFDSTILAKQKLVVSRGGQNDKACIWQNCSKQQVNGVVYCIDHLWETGARR